MTHFLAAVCEPQTPCKCCGADAPLLGVVDFHKNCEARRGYALALSGVPVYYHRCPGCGFVFTTALDRFTAADLRHHVYNDGYAAVDPDYREARPLRNAAFLCRRLAGSPPRRVLDYGGGSGRLAELLRAAGFPRADTHDPLVPEHAARPADRYDLVVSFEVVEHATDPVGTFGDMAGLLADPGLLLFSTLLQPPDIDRQGLNWWYAAPRNGHVSLYTPASLAAIGRRLGLTVHSFNSNLHVLYRTLPEFANGLITRT